METFSALLVLCEGISPTTGGFPSQRPVTWSCDVSFDVSPDKRLSKNRDAGDLKQSFSPYPAGLVHWSNCIQISAYFQNNDWSIECVILEPFSEKWFIDRMGGFGISLYHYHIIYLTYFHVWNSYKFLLSTLVLTFFHTLNLLILCTHYEGLLIRLIKPAHFF